MASQPDDDQHTADQYHDHAATISDAIRRWQNGTLNTFGKRRAIANENQRYYGGTRKSPNTGEVLTSMTQTPDVAAVLADASGIAYECQSAALKALRKAHVLARQALDRQALDDGAVNEVAATIRTEGWGEFRDLVGTASAPPELFHQETFI
jgi:hypothetical protein